MWVFPHQVQEEGWETLIKITMQGQQVELVIGLD